MAISFSHTSAIVEGIIAALKQHLPSDWLTTMAPATETPCKIIDHGDLSHMVYDIDSFSSLMPAIYVKGVSVTQGTAGLDGMVDTVERIRVVHARRRDQTHTASAITLEDNISKAKERYAKELLAALFTDPYRRAGTINRTTSVRTDITLTGATGETAKVWNHVFVSLDYGGGTPETQAIQQARWLDSWAIAIDSDVHCWTG